MTANDSPPCRGVCLLCLLVLWWLAGCGRSFDRPAPTAQPMAQQRPSAIPTATTRAAIRPAAPTATAMVEPATLTRLYSLPTAGPQPATAAPTWPPPQRLTGGGCCWEPFFLDGRVAFLDRPRPEAPAGYYAVALEGGEPALVEPRLGSFHHEGAYFTFVDGERTVTERRSDGYQWSVANEGAPVLVSPDGRRVAWMVREQEGGVERRRVELWWAEEGARSAFVTSVLGGGLIAWLADGRWLAAGGLTHDAAEATLFAYEPATRQRTDLFAARGFRGVAASPDGRWVVFLLAQEAEPSRNGLWLARTDGGETRRLAWFGAYAWRDATSLFYLPFQPGAASSEVWRYDVAAGSSARITDPALTPFRVAQGSFAFAPDGRALVYVSAEDQNLWWLRLPCD